MQYITASDQASVFPSKCHLETRERTPNIWVLKVSREKTHLEIFVGRKEISLTKEWRLTMTETTLTVL